MPTPKPTSRDLAIRLHAAARAGDVSAIREALAAGAKPDGRPPGEVTPLIAAAGAGHTEAVRALLEAGADPNFRHGGKEGTTPLLEALRNWHVEAAHVLISAGADVNEPTDPRLGDEAQTGTSLAIDACNRLHGIAFGYPIEHVGGNPPRAEDRDPSGELRRQLERSLELVRKALEAGGKVRPDKLGESAAYGNLDLLRMLIEHGAAVDALSSGLLGKVTALSQAVEYHQLRAAEALLEAGADPYAGDKPALHEAVIQDLPGIVAAIVRSGAGLEGRTTCLLPRDAWERENPGDPDDFFARPRVKDATPLTLAARCGRKEIVRMLAEAGADLGATDGDGFTALAWALRLGDDETAEALRRSGAQDPADLHGSPFNRLMEAAQAGDETGAIEAIAQGADVNAYLWTAGQHLTPLMVAAGSGHAAISRHLLEAGADPNLAGREDLSAIGITPLMLAARNGHVEVVEQLIAAGADIHRRQMELLGTKREREMGDTALHEAARYGQARVVALLLRAGADPNRSSRQSGTPLTAASASGSRETMDVLIAGGARLGQASGHAGTPLMAAAGSGDLGAVQRLLDAGADPDGAGRDGTTALYHAALAGHTGVVRLLLERGASADGRAQRPFGTPLSAAAFDGHSAVLETLLAAGANPNRVDHEGRTALHMAVLKGEPATVERLLTAGADPLAEDDEGETPFRLAEAAVANWIDDPPKALAALGCTMTGEDANRRRRVLELLRGRGS